jgi:hypothetical protein
MSFAAARMPNAMNSMRMLGTPGLEPGHVGCGSQLDFLNRNYPSRLFFSEEIQTGPIFGS